MRDKAFVKWKEVFDALGINAYDMELKRAFHDQYVVKLQA